MNTKWLKASLAALGAAAFLFAGHARAQQLTTNQGSGFGAEYEVLFTWLGKIAGALQGSTDQNTTANNLVGLPAATGVNTDTNITTSNYINSNNNVTAKLLTTDSGGGRSNAFLAWFFSKDFNLDDPFENLFKDRKIERTNDLDTATEGIDNPAFTFMVGFTQALGQSFNNKGDKDNTDFNALTFPVETKE